MSIFDYKKLINGGSEDRGAKLLMPIGVQKVGSSKWYLFWTFLSFDKTNCYNSSKQLSSYNWTKYLESLQSLYNILFSKIKLENLHGNEWKKPKNWRIFLVLSIFCISIFFWWNL